MPRLDVPRVRWHLGFAVLALLLVLGAPARPAQADPALGMADDGALVTNPVSPGETLDAGRAHGATFLRMIVAMNRFPDDERYLQAARLAAARGMGLDVVLSFRWADASPRGPITPAVFAAWAAGSAARFAALGVPLRVSLLNEPDLLIPASDLCDPQTAVTVLHQAGYRVRTVKRRRARLWRRTHRRARARRSPRAVIGTRMLRRTRRHAPRRTIRRITRTTTQRTTTTITVRRGCFAVQRARRAAEFLRAAVPQVRQAAPSAEIGAGETSPQVGVELFIAELFRVGIPPVDRWAHHPYAWIPEGAGRLGTSPSGWLGPDRLGELRALLRDATDTALPIDATEFGFKHSQIADLDARAAAWRSAYAAMCGRLRSLVAYQWTPTDPATGWKWDTSVLGPGLTETPESRQLPALRCG